MRCIGVDIVEIERIAEAARVWGEAFLGRVYTPGELELCGGRAPSLAGRFAAKEAVVKALGGMSPGFSWREIETLADPRGKPLVSVYGGVRARVAELGLQGFAVSLSDCDKYAIAFVVGE